MIAISHKKTRFKIATLVPNKPNITIKSPKLIESVSFERVINFAKFITRSKLTDSISFGDLMVIFGLFGTRVAILKRVFL